MYNSGEIYEDEILSYEGEMYIATDAPHGHVASLLLLEQSMMGRDSGA